MLFGWAVALHAQLSDAQKVAVLVSDHFDVEVNVTYKIASNYQAKLDVYHPNKPPARLRW